MRRERIPDSQFRNLVAAQAAPADPVDAAVWLYYHRRGRDPIAERVVDIYRDEFEREQLQAWIVAGASDQRINQDLGTTIAILPIYRRLCCNLSNFRDRLEMLRWIHTYSGSAHGKSLLMRALHVHGVEALAHAHGLGSNLDPAEVRKQSMREFYFRGIGTSRASKLGSAESAAATAALKLATAEAEALGGGGDGDLNAVLNKLKLKFREETKTAGVAVPREEILH